MQLPRALSTNSSMRETIDLFIVDAAATLPKLRQFKNFSGITNSLVHRPF